MLNRRRTKRYHKIPVDNDLVHPLPRAKDHNFLFVKVLLEGLPEALLIMVDGRIIW